MTQRKGDATKEDKGTGTRTDLRIGSRPLCADPEGRSALKLVTPLQANRVYGTVQPTHDYLKWLHRKMLDAGYPADHPLVVRVATAMDSMYALVGELQYLGKHRRAH